MQRSSSIYGRCGGSNPWWPEHGDKAKEHGGLSGPGRRDAGSVKDGLKRDLPIDQLAPRPGQARRTIDPDELETLAATIRQLGIIQPIVVRPKAGDEGLDRYEIVAGERRWRAAQLCSYPPCL